MDSQQSRHPVLAVLARLPITVVLSDLTTGRIVWGSSPDLSIIGADSIDDVVGTSLLDFIDPAEQAAALQDLEAIAKGESPPPMTYHLRRVGGGTSVVQISSIPTQFEGRPSMLSLVADLTRTERVRREFAEAKERYEQLVEGSPDGIVVVGNSGIVYVNRTLVEALGASDASELVGESMYRFIHPDFHEAVREARRKMVRYGTPVPPTPVTLVRLDGDCVITTAKSSLVHWDGEPASQTIMRDLAAATSCDADPASVDG